MSINSSSLLCILPSTLVLSFSMKLTSALVAGLATASAEPLTKVARSVKPIKVKLNNWWDGTDYQWYGKISVGTPEQEL